MKTNSKGFTLIELLAVIVILAVVALIAVPQIMNILNNARLSAAADSAYGVLQAAETYSATYMLLHNGDALPGGSTFKCEGASIGCYLVKSDATDKNDKLDFKGTKPTEGVITIDNSGTATITTPLKINNFVCDEEFSGSTNPDIVGCKLPTA